MIYGSKEITADFLFRMRPSDIAELREVVSKQDGAYDVLEAFARYLTQLSQPSAAELDDVARISVQLNAGQLWSAVRPEFFVRHLSPHVDLKVGAVFAEAMGFDLSAAIADVARYENDDLARMYHMLQRLELVRTRVGFVQDVASEKKASGARLNEHRRAAGRRGVKKSVILGEVKLPKDMVKLYQSVHENRKEPKSAWRVVVGPLKPVGLATKFVALGMPLKKTFRPKRGVDDLRAGTVSKLRKGGAVILVTDEKGMVFTVDLSKSGSDGSGIRQGDLLSIVYSGTTGRSEVVRRK